MAQKTPVTPIYGIIINREITGATPATTASYVIDQNNIDHYPFNQSVTIDAMAPELDASPVASNSPQTLTVDMTVLVVAVLAITFGLTLFARYKTAL